MRNAWRRRHINSRRCPIKMARSERCRLPGPLASAHTNSDLIWHLFSTYFVLMRNFSGCLMCCQHCPRWRRTCLFLAGDLHAGLIEIGLPLSTSSFDVILHCEPAFQGPGLSGHSSVRLKQLCTLCVVHILSLQWGPIQISAFHPAYLHGWFISVHFRARFAACWSLCDFLCSQFHFAESERVCTSESALLYFSKSCSTILLKHGRNVHPNRLNWVRSSRGCWCVSELRQ